MKYVSSERLYLTPDGEVSTEPVSGGKLLVGVGGELSAEVAERYGLFERKERKGPATKERKGSRNKAEG